MLEIHRDIDKVIIIGMKWKAITYVFLIKNILIININNYK